MNKAMALLDLFRKGSAVANPVFWKARQIDANLLMPAVLALAMALRQFGINVPLTDDQITAVGVGALTLINTILTVVTTDKIGLPPKE